MTDPLFYVHGMSHQEMQEMADEIRSILRPLRDTTLWLKLRLILTRLENEL